MFSTSIPLRHHLQPSDDRPPWGVRGVGGVGGVQEEDLQVYLGGVEACRMGKIIRTVQNEKLEES